MMRKPLEGTPCAPPSSPPANNNAPEDGVGLPAHPSQCVAITRTLRNSRPDTPHPPKQPARHKIDTVVTLKCPLTTLQANRLQDGEELNVQWVFYRPFPWWIVSTSSTIPDVMYAWALSPHSYITPSPLGELLPSIRPRRMLTLLLSKTFILSSV